LINRREDFGITVLGINVTGTNVPGGNVAGDTVPPEAGASVVVLVDVTGAVVAPPFERVGAMVVPALEGFTVVDPAVGAAAGALEASDGASIGDFVGPASAISL